MKNLALFFGTLITGIVLVIALGPTPVKPQENRLRILSKCMPTEESPVHYHFYLKITHMGTQLTLPDNIGISDGCMQPIDTHDGSQGKVHIHYDKPFPFTLGDFFTVWGVVFNKNQFGGTIASDRRRIIMKVNGKLNHDFDQYIVKNDDIIEIDIKPEYSR